MSKQEIKKPDATKIAEVKDKRDKIIKEQTDIKK
jgi:hypothetical protein